LAILVVHGCVDIPLLALELATDRILQLKFEGVRLEWREVQGTLSLWSVGRANSPGIGSEETLEVLVQRLLALF